MGTVYATAADVEEELGSDLFLYITDRDADGSPDTAAVNAALANVSSVIDGYVSSFLVGGELPVVPAWLKQATIDLAIHTIAEAPTNAQTKAHDDALRKLEHVASGKLKLGVQETPQQLQTVMTVDAAPQVFSRNQSAGIL